MSEEKSPGMGEELRAHHLFCMQLFRGEGYSDGFCVGMTRVIKGIRENPGRPVTLVAKPDSICANCPNKTEDNRCSLDDGDVIAKDRGVLALLGVEPGTALTYVEIVARLRVQAHETDFDTICGACRWRREGLCSWEGLRSRLDRGLG